MATDPRQALDELMKNYRDQSGHLERADRYFRAEPSSVNIGSRVPPALARFRTAWPAVRVATNAYADRVSLEDISFSEAEDTVSQFRDGLGTALQMAILEALATGTGYIRTVVRDNGVSFMATRGRDGAFWEDPDTGEMIATMRVHRPARYKGAVANPSTVTVYTPGRVTTFGRQVKAFGMGDPWAVVEDVTVPSGVLLMRPLINRARAGEPYGRAEARDLYALQDQGSRTLTDLSIATDALAVPQRVLIATLPESISDLSQVQAYMDSILALSGDVKIDQWQAARLGPFIESMNGIGRYASSVSGIPLSYWGLSSDANAASGDAIRENDARLEIRSRQLGAQWTTTVSEQASDVAKLLKVKPGVISVKWADPATPTPTAAADAAIKISQIGTINGEIVVDRDMIWNILRVTPADRQRIRDAEELATINQILNAPPEQPAPTQGAPNETSGRAPGT